jgi:hypothetical protein
LYACQSKSGIAELCGYPEFGTPSSPARLYRTKTIATPPGNPFKFCDVFDDESCTDEPYPNQWHFEWSGYVPGISYEIGVEGDIYVESSSGGYTTFRGTNRHGIIQLDPPQVIDVNILLTPVSGYWPYGFNAVLRDGAEVSGQIEDGRLFTAVPAIYYGGGGPIPGLATLRASGSKGITWWDWNIVNSLDVDTCEETTTDECAKSHKYKSLSIPCDCDSEPNAFGDDFGSKDQTTKYGLGANTTNTSKTERVTSPAGCQVVGSIGTYGLYFGGDITEALTDQDTAADAVARSQVVESWSVANCSTDFAFITTQSETNTFGWQNIQVKASATDLNIGTSYTIRIKFYRRACCGSGTWTYFSEYAISFQATEDTEITEWIDVPNEEGFETRPYYCGIYH